MGAARGGAQRRPSHAAYFVALGGILALLLMLCCYFLYFCVTRVKELWSVPDLSQPVLRPGPPAASPARPAYPVRPVVRDSATAMAKLCEELPRPPPAPAQAAPPQAKGDTVFPARSSPEAVRAADDPPAPAVPSHEKPPAPIAPVAAHETPAVR